MSNMKRNLILVFATLLMQNIYAQTYDYELPVNVKIKTDKGQILESKNVTVIFHFTNSNKDLKSCNGFQFSPHGSDKLDLISAFSAFVNTENWRYISEVNINKGYGYGNKCSLGYIPNYSNTMIEVTKEIFLVKYENGVNTFLIIGYDGLNTLIITM